MAAKKNLTIQLDVETIRKVRILAAERSVSVAQLVAEEIERMVNDEERYRRAHRAAIDLMSHGFHLGGGDFPPREELYGSGTRDSSDQSTTIETLQ